MFADFISTFTGNWVRIIEVLVISAIIYQILISVRGTRTGVVLFGLFILFGVYLFAKMLGLVALVKIFELLLFVGPIAIIIIFMPEIRRFLERAGTTHSLLARFIPTPVSASRKEKEMVVFEAVANAAEDLARKNHGAIIAIEKNEEITPEVMVPGLFLDAEVSELLLKSIFEPRNPLHDGAVVIRGNRVLYSSCFFPLSTKGNFAPELGTRHRAAVGITEKVDCLVVVVSEERGSISISYNGRLAKDLPSKQFREQFKGLYLENPNFVTILPRRASA